jgi:hypothetical protein
VIVAAERRAARRAHGVERVDLVVTVAAHHCGRGSRCSCAAAWDHA